MARVRPGDGSPIERGCGSLRQSRPSSGWAGLAWSGLASIDLVGARLEWVGLGSAWNGGAVRFGALSIARVGLGGFSAASESGPSGALLVGFWRESGLLSLLIRGGLK